MSEPKRSKAKLSLPLSSWIAGSIGLAIVVSLLGFLLWSEGSRTATPPDIVVEKLAVHRQHSGHLVLIKVTNRGGTSAAAVTIEGVLSDNGRQVETNTISVDYVPSGSERQGGFFFTRDPAGFTLLLQAKGYVNP